MSETQFKRKGRAFETSCVICNGGPLHYCAKCVQNETAIAIAKWLRGTHAVDDLKWQTSRWADAIEAGAWKD